MKRILASLFFSFIFANFSFAASFAEGMVEGIGSVFLPPAQEIRHAQNEANDTITELAKVKIELEKKRMTRNFLRRKQSG